MRLLLALFNFLAFEAAWFFAVAGGAAGQQWAGSLPVVAVVAIHLAINARRVKEEAALILAVTLLGVLIEAGFMGAGFIRYAGTVEGQMLPPIWIVALWFGFGTLPNASLAWLRGRWFAQALLGAISGPVTYWAGAKLGAATLPEGGGALFGIGLAWALALPAIFLLAEALSPARRPMAAPE